MKKYKFYQTGKQNQMVFAFGKDEDSDSAGFNPNGHDYAVESLTHINIKEGISEFERMSNDIIQYFRKGALPASILITEENTFYYHNAKLPFHDYEIAGEDYDPSSLIFLPDRIDIVEMPTHSLLRENLEMFETMSEDIVSYLLNKTEPKGALSKEEIEEQY